MQVDKRNIKCSNLSRPQTILTRSFSSGRDRVRFVMTWSRTLEVAPQKFDKLTSTYGQIFSHGKQGRYPEKCIYYSFCVEFYCGHFEPIPDE